MRTRPTLTSADTQKIMAACKAEAEKNSWKVSIAIVDDAGVLLHFERSDGASAAAAEICVGKAKAAAVFRRPTKAVEDLAKDRPAFLKVSIGIPIQGGLPIMYENECVGAVGVSGVQSHEDEAVAHAGIAVLG